MIAIQDLQRAMKEAVSVVCFAGGIDTLVFRKGFEESARSAAEKQEILAYIDANLSQNVYLDLKKKIDGEEFLFSEYYSCPACCGDGRRKFRGAYKPVIHRTFAGIMEIALS